MFKSKKKTNKNNNTTKSNIAAISIGHYSVKCAYLKNNYLYLKEIPILDISEINNIEDHKLLEFQIKAIESAVRFIPEKAEIIFSPHPSLKVFTRLLYPNENDNIREKIFDSVPYNNSNEIAYDQFPLEEFPKRKYLFSATDFDFIRKEISFFGKYQRRIKCIMPEAIGLLNYLSFISSHDERPTIIVDFGAEYTSLIIYDWKDHFIARTIKIGGNKINNFLFDHSGLEFQKAEQFKREKIIINDLLSNENEEHSDQASAAKKVLDEIIHFIKESITYFEDFYVVDISNARIILSGGASKLKKLSEFIFKETSLPIKYAKLPSIETSKECCPFNPEFACTVGLLFSLQFQSHQQYFSINLLKNINEMEVTLPDGVYTIVKGVYYDNKSFKRMKKFRRKTDSLYHGNRKTDKSIKNQEEQYFSISSVIEELQKKIYSLISGEKYEIKIPYKNNFSTFSFKKKIKQSLFMAALIIILISIININYLSPEIESIQNLCNNYSNKREKLYKLMDLSLKKKVEIEEFEIITHKVIWTNKLMLIAKSIPNTIWITDMEVQGSEGDDEKRSSEKVLTISCCVRAVNNHLKNIAQFINNLKNEELFFNDFKDIYFTSAKRDSVDSRILNFELNLPFMNTIIYEEEKKVQKEKNIFQKVEDTKKKIQDKEKKDLKSKNPINFR